MILRAAAALVAASTLCTAACSKRSAPERAVRAGASGRIAGAADANRGKAVFAANCQSCHGVAGASGGVGPALHGERARKNLAETIVWIKNPQPPMPKLYPGTLSEKDVADVAAYVQSL